ncbi:glycosyltransferase [Reyranella sp. CPCC 100927]|uniref:glycosyltransferase family 2 protein n=1 Tax=Reyranella sp. CPCC 100927 TaxID=2599616 RepID=UPI0011B45124|nr:glycosyltransferase family 2 protein [Reyranella sp. CPCC 100927]TWT13695.1 glycosyltransferase family 2 protein [Reyranella sp. CPCC 100927]
MTIHCCAIIPSHNHHAAMRGIVDVLRQIGLPVYVIDDGSAEPAASVLAALHDPTGGVTVIRLPDNRGKGVAVVEGFRAAIAAGFSHALQVDADGQHDLGAVSRMIELATEHPTALVSGAPVFDGSAPMGRRIGRWFTHIWVFIETLSFRITDSMCGFRIYPLAAVEKLLREESTGRYMDFDTDIMVRLFWRGTPPLMVPVRVVYPVGNTSNFDLWRDNVRISIMHTRLVGTMLLRLPRILAHRPPRVGTATHWASLGERGLYWGLRLCAVAYRLLGRRGCLVMMAPAVLYFLATGREQRRASHAFLTRAFTVKGTARRPGLKDSYRHFSAFAARALDTFIGWTGGLSPDAITWADRDAVARFTDDPSGGLVIVSHFGNAELSRALLDKPTRDRLVILVHTWHAQNYNRVLREFRPDAAVNTVEVTQIGPDTAIALKEHVEAGRRVVIAGDRVPIQSADRTSRVPFLGAPAGFSQGPYILAALLDCPVWLLFCQREGGRYVLHVERFTDRVVLPRGQRTQALAAYAEQYARRLQAHALGDPYQWFNFFDFWADRTGHAVG